MYVLAVASQKGGSGKTVIATSLAVIAEAAGRPAKILDLDPQASAAEWSDARGAAPAAVGAQHSRLPKMIDEARAAGIRLLLIDCPPNADTATLAACKAADFVLVPCRPAARDLSAIAATVRLAVDVALKPCAVVLNGCPPGSRLADDAAAAIAEGGVVLCPVRLGQRVAHVTHQPDGRTATECDPRGAAAAELAALAAWVDAQLSEASKRPSDKAPSRSGVRKPRAI